jgi:hypothetical protein
MTRTDPRAYTAPDDLKATAQEQQAAPTCPHFAILDERGDVLGEVEILARYNRRRAMWHVLWAVVGVGTFIGGCLALARWVGGEQ